MGKGAESDCDTIIIKIPVGPTPSLTSSPAFLFLPRRLLSLRVSGRRKEWSTPADSPTH